MSLSSFRARPESELMIEPWKVVESRVTFEDRWLKVRSDRCVNGSGRIIEAYHVLEYPEWVNIVALTERGEIVLAREYRHGVGEVLTGLPCGIMEQGESNPEVTARRELEEETGYAGGTFVELASVYANPGNQSNRVWSFLAVVVQPRGFQRLDLNEEIEIVVEDYVGFMARFWRGGVAIQLSHAAALHEAALQLMKGSGPIEADVIRRALRDEFTRVIVEG
jgi:8-oxo-dGTP pyrophosphatase MutT (NUDIX family)